jgi:hypothetical protein
VERNIIFWIEGQLLWGRWDDHRYQFDHNLYFFAGSGPVRFGRQSFEEWQALGLEMHSRFADPLFVDPDHGDFALRSDAPAFSLGFQAIDLKDVGPGERPER